MTWSPSRTCGPVISVRWPSLMPVRTRITAGAPPASRYQSWAMLPGPVRAPPARRVAPAVRVVVSRRTVESRLRPVESRPRVVVSDGGCGPATTCAGGRKRSAAFGTVSTFVAFATSKSTVAVMPGSSFPSVFGTATTTV